MATPILYVFAISHFCEKARFALDHLGIDYTLKHVPPGPHIQIAKDLGVPGSSLPILATDEQVIQGSSEILTWAEEAADGSRSLSSPASREECLALERRLDDLVGVHARRAFYSEALVEHPDTILPIFIGDLSASEQGSTTEAWPGITQMMIAMMDLGPEQGKESTGIIDRELQELDERLAEGRSFLVNDEFSRADITAASLLAPLVSPPEHPASTRIQLPPRLAEVVLGWRDRRSLRWIGEIYRQYR